MHAHNHRVIRISSINVDPLHVLCTSDIVEQQFVNAQTNSTRATASQSRPTFRPCITNTHTHTRATSTHNIKHTHIHITQKYATHSFSLDYGRNNSISFCANKKKKLRCPCIRSRMCQGNFVCASARVRACVCALRHVWLALSSLPWRHRTSGTDERAWLRGGWKEGGRGKATQSWTVYPNMGTARAIANTGEYFYLCAKQLYVYTLAFNKSRLSESVDPSRKKLDLILNSIFILSQVTLRC